VCVIVALLAMLVSSLAWAGYDVHITRKAFWANTSGEKISLEQWKAYVLVDPQVVNPEKKRVNRRTSVGNPTV